MEIEYDPIRDLLYVNFVDKLVKVAQTITVAPGVHADFDKNKRLMGIEVLEASMVIGGKIEFKLPQMALAQ